ncbi:AAA family ATPase [Halobacillus salinarum]|uniref:AAA family ATPase n=1 Tax=Halobacillus salinarum TaxID=2932257 RepID=A0ABY4EH95_9BACI|nr:AAA family ATPase [Halobacillus salinarum]UOQ43519.1 AAA family ATPase [Halobacillus salinarum]
MRVKEATVYGFGKWRDFSISFDPQFNVISGRNEAGKSTLQQFFLFILFGLPPKKREFYQPKTGGPMGGRLIVSAVVDERVIIERVHDKRNGEALCILSNGEERGEEFLSRLLSGLTRSAFESIYTFNSEDLLKLRSMTGEQLGMYCLISV